MIEEELKEQRRKLANKRKKQRKAQNRKLKEQGEAEVEVEVSGLKCFLFVFVQMRRVSLKPKQYGSSYLADTWTVLAWIGRFREGARRIVSNCWRLALRGTRHNCTGQTTDAKLGHVTFGRSTVSSTVRSPKSMCTCRKSRPCSQILNYNQFWTHRMMENQWPKYLRVMSPRCPPTICLLLMYHETPSHVRSSFKADTTNCFALKIAKESLRC